MGNDVTAIISVLEQVSADARESFGELSGEHLNWKPAADSWSVAQCLDHLILTNDEMLKAIEAKVEGEQNSFWENWSPFTRYLGGFLTKSMKTDSKKFKAPSKTIVPPSEVAADIVEQFVENQKCVAAKIEAADAIDWDKTVVTSPFMKLMTYRLSDGINVLVEHQRRHVRQAKRVMEAEGFPV